MAQLSDTPGPRENPACTFLIARVCGGAKEEVGADGLSLM